MGQRHQAFAIARVVSHKSTTPRYRCIAAWHHQWCYGNLPLLATRRFLTLIKQKDNAEIIRAEIKSIHGKYGVWGEKPGMPDVPCPYTALLLATSWCVDLEPGALYGSSVSFKNNILDADMGSGDGDNNDGISVIDVTDPESPAYCFVSVDGTESETELPRRVPLTAEEYLRAYYPLPTAKELEDERKQRGEEYNLNSINALKGEKIVTLEMLAEAWTAEYKSTLEKRNKTSPPSETVAVSAEVPSLVDLTLPTSVTMAVETGEITQLEHILSMPDKLPLIKSILHGISPFPDSGMPLLEKVVGQEMKSGNTSLVNLSGYALSNSQIIKIASSFSADMKSLNLSYNTIATIDTVREVLTSFPLLTRLVLLGCNAITDNDLKELLSSSPKVFYNLESLIHPFLLSDNSSFPNAFSFIGIMADRHMVTPCSLAYFSPSSVVQALSDILPCFSGDGAMFSIDGTQTTSLVPQAAFASSVRHSEQTKWGQRNVVVFPQTSHGAFKGEGWAFVFNFSSIRSAGNIWGFVRRTSSEGPFEVLDLRSFLTRMVDEGRPVVAEEAIEKLDKILEQVKARLASPEDMAQFVSSADEILRHAYY